MEELKLWYACAEDGRRGAVEDSYLRWVNRLSVPVCQLFSGMRSSISGYDMASLPGMNFTLGPVARSLFMDVKI